MSDVPKPSEAPDPEVEIGAPKEAAPERTVAIVRTSLFRARPFRTGGLALLGLLGLSSGLLSFLGESSPTPNWLRWPGFAIGVIAVLWLFVWWVATHFWIRLEVTTRRTIRHEGIVKRHSTEVVHDHVRSVDIQQSFLERIFDIGTLGIDSAGQDKIEILVHDIPHPHRVKAMIDGFRRF